MIDDIFQNAESDATFWVSLRDMIQASSATLPAVVWRPEFSFPSPSEDSETIRKTKFEAIRAFGLSSEDSMRAFFHTMREHEWPELTEPQVWNLSISLGEIVRFLDLCFVPVDGRKLSLFRWVSTDNIQTAAVWFYFRWWPDVGIHRWLDDALRDEQTFYRYFGRPKK